MPLRRVIQMLSLGCFLALIWLAAFPMPDWIPADAFLRMDPLVLAGTLMAARTWAPGLFLALIVLALTMLVGRFFCGYLCPLGTTLDLTDRLLASNNPRDNVFPGPDALALRRVKYLLLVFIAAAALLGVSALFLASPLSLITRFYALLVHPPAALIGDELLQLLRPAALRLDWTWAAYAETMPPRYATQWFILFFFLGVFLLARHAPRFWCRYLCPSGALFALFSRRPLVRRGVNESCTRCGACQKACPMAAIGRDPHQTRHEECISCQTCVAVCPVHAVSFAWAPENEKSPPFWPQRRQMLAAGLAGAGAATLTFTGLTEVREELLPGNPMPAVLIRPPGALPEKAFLQRCIRCGLCMRACPSNTLQPLWFQAGVAALFSPKITPRRGACLPECTMCGDVCPTGALRRLPLAEKIWAKVGTAAILRRKCLAWEWGKECLVCDEVCPYDAIELRRVPESSVPVPFVREEKCAGCGFCEFHCPVRAASAIVVEPMEALRLESGSYREAAQAIGLDLRRNSGERMPQGGADDPADDAALPPGFTF